MAEAAIYPQIPSTVWTGVWKILHDSPSRRVDENVLSVELGVQKTAAKQYLKELIRLGLFKDDGTTTDLAKRWRQDGEEPGVIKEILAEAYPQVLLELAPIDRLDRDKIVRWFMSEGLGRGSAQNKAATYIRVASGVSAAESVRSSKVSNTKPVRSGVNKSARARESDSQLPSVVDGDDVSSAEGREERGGAGNGGHRNGKRQPELNVNVQVHISADSSSEQIDAIFSAMRKYFDGDQAI